MDIEQDGNGYISGSIFRYAISVAVQKTWQMPVGLRSAGPVHRRLWRRFSHDGSEGKGGPAGRIKPSDGCNQTEAEQIKAWFEKQAVEDLRDTKNKTVEYWGNGNSRVVVGSSETVKPVSMTMVKKLMGEVFGDL